MMPLWGISDSANSAPKYTTDASTGHTGTQDYGNTIIFVYGNEGFSVGPGWARKIVGTGSRSGRVSYETLISLPSIINGLLPPTGYVFLVDENDAYITDENGNYLITEL